MPCKLHGGLVTHRTQPVEVESPAMGGKSLSFGERMPKPVGERRHLTGTEAGAATRE